MEHIISWWCLYDWLLYWALRWNYYLLAKAIVISARQPATEGTQQFSTCICSHASHSESFSADFFSTSTAIVFWTFENSLLCTFKQRLNISDKHHVLVGCCYLRDFFIDKNLSDSLSGSPCEFAEYTTAEWCCWWLVLISSLCDNIIMCNSTEAHWMICSSSEWNGFPSIKSGEWFACKQYLFHSLKLLDLQCSRK